MEKKYISTDDIRLNYDLNSLWEIYSNLNEGDDFVQALLAETILGQIFKIKLLDKNTKDIILNYETMLKIADFFAASHNFKATKTLGGAVTQKIHGDILNLHYCFKLGKQLKTYRCFKDDILHRIGLKIEKNDVFGIFDEIESIARSGAADVVRLSKSKKSNKEEVTVKSKFSNLDLLANQEIYTMDTLDYLIEEEEEEERLVVADEKNNSKIQIEDDLWVKAGNLQKKRKKKAVLEAV